MSIRIVQLGKPKKRGEGVRLGTVRRPPRGVPRNRYAAEGYFDVWLPNLAPSAQLINRLREQTDSMAWKRFTSAYRAEMSRPENSRLLDALAALSKSTNFSVGCYCEDERRCHRSILRKILKEHKAVVAN